MLAGLASILAALHILARRAAQQYSTCPPACPSSRSLRNISTPVAIVFTVALQSHNLPLRRSLDIPAPMRPVRPCHDRTSSNTSPPASQRLRHLALRIRNVNVISATAHPAVPNLALSPSSAFSADPDDRVSSPRTCTPTAASRTSISPASSIAPCRPPCRFVHDTT